MLLGDRGLGVALAHQHPAAIAQHGLAVLVGADRAHVDHAGLAVRALLEADHLGDGRQGLARIDRPAEPALGVAEIGERVEGDVRHGLAEHHVEGEQVVERALRVAEGAGEGVRRLHGEARAVEAGVERHVADRHGARRGVADGLAEAEILEEAAGIRLHGRLDPDCA